jgi:hypothetical protein
LRRIVKLLGVDRAQLIRFSADGDAYVTHSGAVDGVPEVSPKPMSYLYPWAVQSIRKGSPVIVPDVAALPADSAVDRASWSRVGVRSHLSVPLRVAGHIEGVIAFGCLRTARDWPEDLVERVGVLAHVLANALAHKRTVQALDAAIEFEQSASRILAALLTMSPVDQDRIIECGLGDLARSFGADRATLWQRAGDEFVTTHRWLARGVMAPSHPLPAAALRGSVHSSSPGRWFTLLASRIFHRRRAPIWLRSERSGYVLR